MNASNWVTLLVNGLIAVLLGLLALFVPEESIVTISRYFGFVILIAGVVILLTTLRKGQKAGYYMLMLVEAIAAIIIGLIILFYTRETLSVFAILVALWAIIIGLLQLILASRLLKGMPAGRIMMFNGVISLIFGALMFLNPFGSLVIFTRLSGVFALVIGVVLLYLTLVVRKVKG